MAQLKRIVTYKINIKFIPFGIPILAIVLFFLILIIVLISGFFYYQKITKSPGSYTKDIVSKVGKIIDIPSETPSVATVNDPDKLKSGESSAFFRNAQKGDLLLIFSASKKIILYRPETNKIINTANASLAIPSPSPSPTPASNSYKFVILNGTNTSGLASKMASQVEGKIQGSQIIEKGNTIKTDYTKTVAIDLSGKRSSDVQNIAESLDILISNFPASENRPQNADFLIIIGEDWVK